LEAEKFFEVLEVFAVILSNRKDLQDLKGSSGASFGEF